MTPEDLQEMERRLSQEELLHWTGFEPIRPDSRELWLRDHELFTRRRALVVALAEQVAGDRGAASFADGLTSENTTDEGGER